jgi:hypothetical protein
MKLYLLGVALMLIFIGVYKGIPTVKKWTQCRVIDEKSDLSKPVLLKADGNVSVKLKLTRLAASGCLTRPSSEAFQNIHCEFKTASQNGWKPTKIIKILDTNLEYIVACEFPKPAGPIFYYKFGFSFNGHGYTQVEDSAPLYSLDQN